MDNMTETQRSEKVYNRDLFFHNLTPERKYPFMNEVWAIMASFGNIGHSIDESVEAMHEILYCQMKLLLFKAEKIAKLRLKIPPKILEITHEDILFLMRPYRVKIKRLLEHLRGMDIDTHINIAVNYDVVDTFDTRVHQCLQFFAEIQDCDEFTSILDEDIVDLEMKRILERRDLMTKFMTQEEYDRYQELLLQTNFCSENQRKFKKWLLKRIHINSENVDISELAITILEFLARETIANVTDMAFHIKAVKRSKKRKHENEDDVYSKKVCLKDMELFCMPNTEEVMLPGDPVDAAVIGEGVVLGLNNMFFKHTVNLIKGETLTEELYPDVSDFSEDFKTIHVYQSKITKKEVMDAYMQFQYQRKPWLFFGDISETFWKNTTLICLAHVDDHKVP